MTLPPVTVTDLQRLALPVGTTLAGGAGGLHNPVTWAISGRTTQPVFPRLHGGELVLLTERTLRAFDPPVSLSYILERLARVGVAAVVLEVRSSGYGGSLGTEAGYGGAAPESAVPLEACKMADNLNLPLLLIPVGPPLAELENSITRAIAQERESRYELERTLQRRFQALLLGGKGIQVLLETLAEVSGKSCAVEDEGLALRYLQRPKGGKQADAWLPAVRSSGYGGAPGTQPGTPGKQRLAPELAAPELAGAGEVILWARSLDLGPGETPVADFPLPELGLVRRVAPCVARETILGFLSLFGPSDSFTATDHLALIQAAAVCSVELAREAAVDQVEVRLQVDLVDELLRGISPDPEMLAGRVRRLGLDLNRAHWLALVALDNAPEALRPRLEGELLRWIARALVRQKPGSLIQSTADGILLLWPADVAGKWPADSRGKPGPLLAQAGGAGVRSPGTEAEHRATLTDLVDSRPALTWLRSLCDEAHLALHLETISAGMARLAHAGTEDGQRRFHIYAQRYQEARQTLSLAQSALGGNQVAYYEDLDIYRLLLPLLGNRELQAFHDDVLGDLLEYDRKNRGDLLPTLAVYLECNGHAQLAAEHLFLHRNSIAYRLRRIEEISGLHLDKYEDLLRAYVALKINRILP